MGKPFIIINRKMEELYTMDIDEAIAKKIFTFLVMKCQAYYHAKLDELEREPFEKILANKRAIKSRAHLTKKFNEDEFIPGIKSTNSMLRIKIPKNITVIDFYEHGCWAFFERVFKELEIEYVKPETQTNKI